MIVINKYDIVIKNRNYKDAVKIKKFLGSLKIPAKISIIALKDNKVKYCCYISKFSG